MLSASVVPTLKEDVQRQALELGFDVCRVSAPQLDVRQHDDLSAFLLNNYHAGMDWMEPRQNERAAPQMLWPEVRSVIMLGMNYAPDADPMARLARKSNGVVSVYAQGQDYHNVIKPKLKQLAAHLGRQNHQAKVFVDTAPVMEKPLAQAAGLGWQGKHTVLVSRDFGSWLFLGAIYTDAVLSPDNPEQDHCGSCRKCLDVCPTNAFPAPYQLDARRCISYLTIEHKGVIPRDLRRAFGNRIFGCDDCLAVCPWNKFAAVARETALVTRRDIDMRPLSELLQLDDAGFRALFAKTPVKRTGRNRFIRNCLIAAGNANDTALAAPVRALLDDESPLVRGAAVWALSQLAPEEYAQARARASQEVDDSVREEWAFAAATV